MAARSPLDILLAAVAGSCALANGIRHPARDKNGHIILISWAIYLVLYRSADGRANTIEAPALAAGLLRCRLAALVCVGKPQSVLFLPAIYSVPLCFYDRIKALVNPVDGYA